MFAPLFAFALAAAGASTAAPSDPWCARGDEVEAVYKAYEERLDRFYEVLTGRLKADAPDLLPSLKNEAPTPVAHGYQILPHLLADSGPPSRRPRAAVSAYSWPWTRTMIGREAEKLDALEADLARSPSAADKRALYEKLAAGYKPLRQQQALIDSHIQYNRLWQKSIALNRDLYDRQTRLENAVVERQAILDACEAGKTRGGCDDSRRSRERTLARDIHEATDEVSPSAFIRVEHPSPHDWIVRVPFITDIVDKKFLGAFQSAVETEWSVKNGLERYRAVVSIEPISTSRLYEKSGMKPPKAGDQIDLAKHFALFPPGYAVLTTGAPTTHVEAGRAIVVGANDLHSHDLAHEFGHILGFKDVYFRGYLDLGADGFEVQEVIADADDIMGAPGWGSVRPEHFTRLITAVSSSAEEAALSEMMSLGLGLMYSRHDAAAAAAEFKRVLKRCPTHYGATYQLAAALDLAGRGSEALPYWRDVLRMAETYHDQPSADTARARLGDPVRREEGGDFVPP